MTQKRKASSELELGAQAAGVERDLALIAARAPELASGALAAMARALAVLIDTPGNSATSKSMCAHQLRETLDQLREFAPPVEEKTKLDDLSARRAARLSGGANPAA